jgi:hypothetical protein
VLDDCPPGVEKGPIHFHITISDSSISSYDTTSVASGEYHDASHTTCLYPQKMTLRPRQDDGGLFFSRVAGPVFTR